MCSSEIEFCPLFEPVEVCASETRGRSTQRWSRGRVVTYGQQWLCLVILSSTYVKNIMHDHGLSTHSLWDPSQLPRVLFPHIILLKALRVRLNQAGMWTSRSDMAAESPRDVLLQILVIQQRAKDIYPSKEQCHEYLYNYTISCTINPFH